jgi:hypothetical protein
VDVLEEGHRMIKLPTQAEIDAAAAGFAADWSS